MDFGLIQYYCCFSQTHYVHTEIWRISTFKLVKKQQKICKFAIFYQDFSGSAQRSSSYAKILSYEREAGDYLIDKLCRF